MGAVADVLPAVAEMTQRWSQLAKSNELNTFSEPLARPWASVVGRTSST
jgi:hypothetical protein